MAGTDRRKQIDQSFLLALGRRPSPAESEKAGVLFTDATPQDALARLGVVLFNLNEFIYLE